jgi:hypothetical protein
MLSVLNCTRGEEAAVSLFKANPQDKSTDYFALWFDYKF